MSLSACLVSGGEIAAADYLDDNQSHREQLRY